MLQKCELEALQIPTMKTCLPEALDLLPFLPPIPNSLGESSVCHSSPCINSTIRIMAGGDTAIRRAVEGAEDSIDGAIRDFQLLDPPLSQSDVVIGIASSGRTPYVLGGLSYARENKILSIGICCVKPSEMRGRCDHVVECVVGPEIVTGSTRMKAGTATKLVRRDEVLILLLAHNLQDSQHDIDWGNDTYR